MTLALPLLLVATLATSLVSAELFDVTTIYRLEESPIRKPVPNVTVEVDVPDCYVTEDGECDWKLSGFNITDNVEAEAVEMFPPRVTLASSTSQSNVSVMKIDSEEMAIELKPSSPNVEVSLYFMSGQDVATADLIVVKLYPFSMRNGNTKFTPLYKCLLTQKGRPLAVPGVGQRECVNLAVDLTDFNMYHHWDTNKYTDVRVIFTNNLIIGTSPDKEKQFFNLDVAKISSEMKGEIRYLGVSTTGSFRYSTPVPLLALAEKTGFLSTMLVPSLSRDLLCLEMQAYIDPLSGGAISVVAVQGDVSQQLGSFNSSGSKHQAETWKFVSKLNLDKTLPWMLKIIARKKSSSHVIITNVTRCRNEDFEVASINSPSTVEIHGRTNARGMPFASANGYDLVSGATNVDLSECSGGDERCDWSVTNWTLQESSQTIPSPDLKLAKGHTKSFTILPSTRSQSKPINGSLEFRSTITDFKIFLTGSNNDITSYSSYYFYFKAEGQQYNVRAYLCMPSYYGRGVNTGHPGINPYGCSQLASKTLQLPKRQNVLLPGDSVRVSLSIGGHYTFTLRVRVDTPAPGPVDTLEFSHGSSIDLKHYSLSAVQVSGEVSICSDNPVMSLSESTGTLTSPWMLPHGDEICVALEVYMEATSSIQLAVEMKDSTGEVQAQAQLQPKLSELGAWSRHRLTLALPGGSRGRLVRVIATGIKQRGELLVQRIAGCSAEEDIRVVSFHPTTTVKSPGFGVPLNNRSSELKEDISCEHGAMMDVTHARCVCPAGFTGSTCAEGCGANRYGDDCGGMCSLSRRGCRNMVLCRPQLGCRCAPGFKGMLCDTECEPGEYGASCRQRCGRCAGETCDIYTGVCHEGCKDGRFPPFCQHLYKHLREPPVVKLLGYDAAVISADVANSRGHGHVVSSQLQYKEEEASDWTSQTPQRVVTHPTTGSATNTEVGHVTELKSGVRYQVRVLLIDVTGRRYEGEQVPVTSFNTNCIVPESVDYQLKISHQGKSNIKVMWTYPTDNGTWCAVQNYEVRLTSGLLSVIIKTPADATTAEFIDLLPGVEYQLQIMTMTKRGPVAASLPITARTSEEAPDHVINLQASQGEGRSFKVTWQPPRRPAGVIKRYQLSYQCLHLLGCPEQTCAGSQGDVETMTSSSVIAGLLPHAVYKISVAGVSGSVGPNTALLAATNTQPSSVAPGTSARPVTNRGNSTLTVHWEPPSADNCSELNGYLLGYRYELTKPPQLVPLLEGFTTNTTANFTHLEPHTHYLVKVYVVTEDGWSSAHALEIPANTRATTPSEVRDLVVYSRDRRRLSLRWKEPLLMYGNLESFTVTVSRGDVTPVSVTVTPQRCVAWPLLFCHTIRDLQSDTNYSITVQARNSEVAEDGHEASISALTKESASEPPTYLRVVNLTADSATIEWGIPDLINGKLRSFLISIEETDSADSSECCQNFPLRELQVSGEQANYQMQMTGLNPASTYSISVSAKTVGMGQAVTLTLHTRPRPPVLTEPPRLLSVGNQESRIQVHVTPYKPDQLVSRYLLFIEGRSSDIWSHDEEADAWLAEQITATTNQSISLVAEFTQAALSTNTVSVELHDHLLDGSTNTGKHNNAKDIHRLLLALVLDYNGSISVGFIWSEPFSPSALQIQAS